MDVALHLKGGHAITLSDQRPADVDLIKFAAGLNAHGVARSGTTLPLTRLSPMPPVVLTSPSTVSLPTWRLIWIPTPASACVVIEAKRASRSEPS
jgi:hypothetical protein